MDKAIPPDTCTMPGVGEVYSLTLERQSSMLSRMHDFGYNVYHGCRGMVLTWHPRNDVSHRDIRA